VCVNRNNFTAAFLRHILRSVHDSCKYNFTKSQFNEVIRNCKTCPIHTQLYPLHLFLGWLNPLLARIKEDDTNVVVPLIDVIDQDTFSYVLHNKISKVSDLFVGGFDWGLIFNWHLLPEREQKRIGNKTHVPVRYVTSSLESAFDPHYTWRKAIIYANHHEHHCIHNFERKLS